MYRPYIGIAVAVDDLAPSGAIDNQHTCKGYPGYIREPHWKWGSRKYPGLLQSSESKWSPRRYTCIYEIPFVICDLNTVYLSSSAAPYNTPHTYGPIYIYMLYYPPTLNLLIFFIFWHSSVVGFKYWEITWGFSMFFQWRVQDSEHKRFMCHLALIMCSIWAMFLLR